MCSACYCLWLFVFNSGEPLFVEFKGIEELSTRFPPPPGKKMPQLSDSTIYINGPGTSFADIFFTAKTYGMHMCLNVLLLFLVFT